jgi:hypothetical protein
LNIDLGINNERQDCKLGTVYVGVLVQGSRVKRGYEGERIWLMGFVYMHICETVMKPLSSALSGEGMEGVLGG